MKSYHLKSRSEKSLLASTSTLVGTTPTLHASSRGGALTASHHQRSICLHEQRRGLKTFDRRGRRDEWHAIHIEQTQYQVPLYWKHPWGYHAWPEQFNNHFDSSRRVYDVDLALKPNAIPDFQNWGRTNGQADQPLRHQRVAFDFNDELHPTKIYNQALQPKHQDTKDSVFGMKFNVSSKYDPSEEVYNAAVHKNHFENIGRPGDYFVKRPRAITKPGDRLKQIWGDNHEFNRTSSSSIQGFTSLVEEIPNERVEWDWLFNERVRPELRYTLADGRIPGVNAPFKGDQDPFMMLAMSKPARDPADFDESIIDNTVYQDVASRNKPILKNERDGPLGEKLTRDWNAVTLNEGFQSKVLYINRPQRDNELDESTLDYLIYALNKADSGMVTKCIMLRAAQSGESDFFSSGISLTAAANLMKHAVYFENSRKEADLKANSGKAKAGARGNAVAYEELKNNALDHLDETLRLGCNLLWKVFTAKKPLIVTANGRCSNIGNGLALLSKYSAMQRNTELTQNGPECGVTPFGGMTHFLCRPETELKYPGLAEFVMLTGAPLFAGDALKLGWTDLCATLPGVDHHMKKWFEDSAEHIYNDAAAYQLGMLLDECFRPSKGNSSHMNPKSYLTPTKAKWIEEVFADQSSVQSIIDTLTEVEKIPLTDTRYNTQEPISFPTSLPSVEAGVELINSKSLQFTLEPWDISSPPSSLHPHETMRGYEFTGAKSKIAHSMDEALVQWKKHRTQEYVDYVARRNVDVRRHVFARLEGAEGTLVDFEHTFNAVAQGLAASPIDSKQPALEALLDQVKVRLNYPKDRPLELAWYLPTEDTCPIRCDADLHTVLMKDPGILNPKAPTEQPPLYLVVNRSTQYFSEWAYTINHQLNLVSPTALCASLSLIRSVKELPEENAIANTLGLEMRYASRMMGRSDFYQVGMAGKTMPSAEAEKYLEKNVLVNGHTYSKRPLWEPRTVADVNEEVIEQIGATPLSYTKDGVTEFQVPVDADQKQKIVNICFGEVPIERVGGLGESTKSSSSLSAQSDVTIPEVDFYDMNRHPWLQQKNSWRQDGFTKGSQEYFERKYQEAVQAMRCTNSGVTGETGGLQAWPGPAATQVHPSDEQEQKLLKERLWDVLDKAKNNPNTGVSPMMKELRKQAEEGSFTSFKLDPLTMNEKHYDDHFYKWFIQPGHNPNPSGVLRYGTKSSSAGGGVSDNADSVGSRSKGAWAMDFEDELDGTDLDAMRGGGDVENSSLDSDAPVTEMEE